MERKNKMSTTQHKEPEPPGRKTGELSSPGKRDLAKMLFIAALFLVQFGFFSFIALKRPTDVDEGFFLVLGKSIFVHGRMIYRDFFSPQMPLLPYVYGVVMKLFGYEWEVARLLTASFVAVIGTVLGKYALDRTGSRIFALSVAVIFCFSPFIFIWYSCGRTPALATFFLIVSISLLPPIAQRGTPLLYALSGFCVGLGADTRLYLVVVAPVLAFHIWQVEKGEARRALAYFAGGVALALMFNLPFFIASPAKYLWGIIGVHGMKTPEGLVGQFSQKLDLMLKILFDHPDFRPTLYLGYLTIFIAYPVSRLVRRTPLSQWNPAFHVAAAICLVSLLPTPTFSRYFSVPVPFYFLLAIDLYRTVSDRVRSDFSKKAMVGAVALGTVLFALLAAGKIDFYIFKGNNLGGSMPTEGGKEDWNRENVEEVSRAIDRLVAPDAAVLSLWPGYLLESNVDIMPRTDNMVMLELEHAISERQLALSQTITDAEIRQRIRTKEIDLLIFGNSIAPQTPDYKTLLIANNYKVAEKIGGISLFLSPEYSRNTPAAQ